jgi:hypothetical protein
MLNHPTSYVYPILDMITMARKKFDVRLTRIRRGMESSKRRYQKFYLVAHRPQDDGANQLIIDYYRTLKPAAIARPSLTAGQSTF